MTLRPFVHAIAILLFFALPTLAQLPAPTPKERAASLKLLQEIFGDDYRNAETRDAKTALAKKILQIAMETKDDDVARFAMMKLSSDIAVQAGDAAIANEAIDAMRELYQFDSVTMRMTALAQVTRNANHDELASTMPFIVQFCQSAAKGTDYGAAQKLLSEIQKTIRNGDVRSQLDRLIVDVNFANEQFQLVKPHLATLESAPADPKANTHVGRFRCFLQDDWDAGLQNLIQGNNAELATIAKAEIEGGKNAKTLAAVADQWWEYAEKINGPFSVAAKLRASEFYTQAVKSLRGLQKAKAIKRLDESKSLTTSQLIGAGPRRPKAGNPVVPATNAAGAPMAQAGPQLQPMADARAVYDFPASFDEVELAGSGRYLVFRMATLNKLAFFDVFERKVVKFVDLQNSDILFTAGSEAFYVLTRPQNVIERWSLKDFTKQSATKLAFDLPVQEIAMGHASMGPIYAGAETGSGALLDGRSLRPLRLEAYDHQYNRRGEIHGAGRKTIVRRSANGRVFTLQQTTISPSGFRVFLVGNRGVNVFNRGDSMGYLSPSFDGELIYTAKGIYTNQTREYAGNDDLRATSFRVPAVTGNYAVAIPRDDRSKNKTTTHVHLLVNGQVTPVLTIPNVEIRPGEYGDFHERSDSLTLDRRIYLLPEAKLLITLPASNKSLILHRLDLEEEFANSGVDYLFVASRSPGPIQAGNTYRYQIEVRSRKGGVTFELVSAPKGMTINEKGLVIWRTQRRTALQQDVIVAIKDSAGQEISHTFKLQVAP